MHPTPSAPSARVQVGSPNSCWPMRAQYLIGDALTPHGRTTPHYGWSQTSKVLKVVHYKAVHDLKPGRVIKRKQWGYNS